MPSRTTSPTRASDTPHETCHNVKSLNHQEELAAWHRDEFGPILFFIGSRLEESDPDLYGAFFEYLSDASARTDHFHIILVWEADEWTDTVLNNLPEPTDALDPLTVRVALIEDLASLTDATYKGMAAVVGE